MTSLLAVNGFIHSVSDPYATAILIDDGVVAWVGADDTAEKVAAAQAPNAQLVDLHGALVAPAFLNSFTTEDSVTGRAEYGEVLYTTTAVRPSAHAVPYVPLDRADADTQSHLYVDLNDVSHVDAALRLSRADRRQLLFHSHREHQLAALLPLLVDDRAQRQFPGSHRLILGHLITDDDVSQLNGLGVSVTVVPSPETETITAPVASLLSAGIPVSLGTGSTPHSLWHGVRSLLEHQDPDQRVSARAGFTAATRAGARALPADLVQTWMNASRLAPGSPAHLNLWRADELSVQAPDGRVSGWSTDARAGTPLLPVLGGDTPLPQLIAHLYEGNLKFGTL
ncbi:amidohydrolase family protein [Citricoccus muralis]|uniref:Amidohydrolase family protein n=1 Tax=Citricoccus muralis TaxID=169134 RepID=A0ABY8H2S1_9MICC|nr:amidohydrolase family protein [Citricoccus muralis]WFP15360.1 amidohydrolase family protein [Citricoccus muralis]